MQEELSNLETQLLLHDHEFFDIIEKDIVRISEHILLSEAYLLQQTGLLQKAAMQAGFVWDELQIQKLERSLPVKAQNRTVLCQQILALRMQIAPKEMIIKLQELITQYNDIAAVANQYTQYLEVNVAGFRKLLKRHEKQIPWQFHARRAPFCGYHRLVTHRSHQFLETLQQLGVALRDARCRIDVEIIGGCTSVDFGSQPSHLHESQGFGPECQMVLEIQRQLKSGIEAQYLSVETRR